MRPIFFVALLAACAGPTAAPHLDALALDLARGPTSTEHPPIQMAFNVHGHAFGLDDPSTFDDWYGAKDSRYDRHYDEMIWLARASEHFGGRMSYQLNGEFSEYAEVRGDEGRLRFLRSRGHSMGIHFHHNVNTGVDHFWEEVPEGVRDDSFYEDLFDDHFSAVQSAVGASPVRADAAFAPETDDEWDQYEALLQDHNVTAIGAGEAFSGIMEWNQNPFNPYRRAYGTQVEEDWSGSTIAIPSYPQVGLEEPGGLHRLYTSIPQLKRQFLMVLANRHWEQTTGLPSRVWTMNVMTHLDQNTRHAEILDWMRFIGHTAEWTGGADPATEWVTDAEIIETFEEWETTTTAATSFDFDLESHDAGVDQDYPYLLEAMAETLVGTEFKAQVDLHDDVLSWRLDHRDMEYLGTDWHGNPEYELTDADGEMIMAWSTDGLRTVDVRGWATGSVTIMDADDGSTRSVPAAAVPIGPKPVLIVSDTSLL